MHSGTWTQIFSQLPLPLCSRSGRERLVVRDRQVRLVGRRVGGRARCLPLRNQPRRVRVDGLRKLREEEPARGGERERGGPLLQREPPPHPSPPRACLYGYAASAALQMAPIIVMASTG